MANDESELQKGKGWHDKRKIINNNYSEYLQQYSTCTSKHHSILLLLSNTALKK